MRAFHFVSASCRGENCTVCSLPATHKVGEAIQHDDPIQMRHPLTSYLCCAHFVEVMGKPMTGRCREMAKGCPKCGDDTCTCALRTDP